MSSSSSTSEGERERDSHREKERGKERDKDKDRDSAHANHGRANGRRRRRTDCKHTDIRNTTEARHVKAEEPPKSAHTCISHGQAPNPPATKNKVPDDEDVGLVSSEIGTFRHSKDRVVAHREDRATESQLHKPVDEEPARDERARAVSIDGYVPPTKQGAVKVHGPAKHAKQQDGREGSAGRVSAEQPRVSAVSAEEDALEGSSTHLAEYGSYWAMDAVVLYTNSVRAEIKHLLKLIGYVQAVAQLGGFQSLSAIMDDFEQWWNYFARYTEVILKGFDQVVLPAIVAGPPSPDKKDKHHAASAPLPLADRTWVEEKEEIFKKTELAKDAVSTVDNRILRVHRYALLGNSTTNEKVVPAFLQSVDALSPALSQVLDYIDQWVPTMLTSRFTGETHVWPIHLKFVELITKDPMLGLGWSGVATLTDWMPSDKAKAAFLSTAVRGFRRMHMKRALADNEHQHVSHRLQVKIAAEKKRLVISQFDLS